SQPPRNVAVVIHSGESDERRLTGTLLGVDRSNDLAVLRVDRAGGPPLPEPLKIDATSKLIELQKGSIFGFPFGSDLGKNITVSPSAISSLRTEGGVLKKIQVNGGMHPGNSGGPLTDSRGNVVGVAVAGIPGTQVNFAIPAAFVKQVFDGRIGD